MFGKSNCITLVLAVIVVLLVINSCKQENFSAAKKPEIILYYADWCGYSNQFLPIWNEFKTYAEENLKQVDVNTILCDDNNASKCKGIGGFPTVLLKKPNETIPFASERTKDSLIKFVTDNI
jgi:hypothetical protein